MRVTGSMLWGNSASLYKNQLISRTGQNIKSAASAKAAAIKKNGYNLPDSFYTKSQTVNTPAGQADSLRNSALTFTATGSSSLFERAKKNGSNGELMVNARQLASSYNATLKNLRNNPTALNNYTRQAMENAFHDNADALKDIGINVNYDRSVTIDEAKFRSSDTADIEKVLGKDSELMKSIERYSSSAEVGLNRSNTLTSGFYNSLGSYGFNDYGLGGYGGFGNSVAGNNYLSALYGSKYNFWF